MRGALYRLPALLVIGLLALSPSAAVYGGTGGHITIGTPTLRGAGVRPFSTASNGGTSFGILIAPVDGTAYTVSFPFTDDTPNPSFGTSTVTFGDGSPAATPTITGSNGSYTASASHTWANEGTYTVTLTINDGTATSTSTTSYTVSEGDLAVSNGPLSLAEGSATTGAVLTFTDGLLASAESDNPYTASVNWGDGTTETATVSGPSGGVYTVAVPASTHAYADEGSFTAVVTVNETGVSQTPLFTSQVAVTATEADTLTPGTPSLVAATEGTAIASGTLLVAFTDSGYPTNAASDFTATIDWGDGSPTDAGTVVSAGGGVFNVTTSGHTYVDEGSYTVAVTLADDAPGTASSTATWSLPVAEADTFSPNAISLTTATEGTAIPVGTVVQTVADTGYPGNTAADFTATINWGDGSPTDAATVTMSAGVLSISTASAHTYADECSCTLTVVVSDDAPGTATNTSTGTVTVGEADTLTGALAVSSLPYVFSGTVAVFGDTGYPTNDPADFTATIDWGDATTSAGVVTAGPGGTFLVSGSHSYASNLTSVTLSVTLKDDAPGTAQATASGTVPLQQQPPTITKSFGTSSMSIGDTTSLTFTVGNPAANAASLTNVGFTDFLPTGLVVATPNGLSGTCGGGTITATPGAHTVSLAGATLAPGATCTFSVNVTATTYGTKRNMVQAFADNTGLGPTGTATVTVQRPDLWITKHHAGTFTRGQQGTWTILVTNVGAGASTNLVTVTDLLPAGMTPVWSGGTGWTCSTLGFQVTCTRSDVLAAGASYPPLSVTAVPTAFASSLSVNVARVSTVGDTNSVNNVAVDPTTVR